jgi:hypothetical protein
MNERIRELAEQAGLEFDDDLVLEPEAIYYTTQKDLEKFAELIVRECVEVCGSVAAVRAGYHDADGRDTADSCGDQIKEHFGVE